jgi:hypothetical protein
MKIYIVYVNGIEAGMIKAGSHNAAEKKAKKEYSKCSGVKTDNVSVAYTEI